MYSANSIWRQNASTVTLRILERIFFSVHNVLLGSFHLYNGKIIEKTHNSTCSHIRLWAHAPFQELLCDRIMPELEQYPWMAAREWTIHSLAATLSLSAWERTVHSPAADHSLTARSFSVSQVRQKLLEFRYVYTLPIFNLELYPHDNLGFKWVIFIFNCRKGATDSLQMSTI